jgi:beta-lactamase class A
MLVFGSVLGLSVSSGSVSGASSTTITTATAPRAKDAGRINENPFANRTLRAFLASRSGEISAGLYNVATGQTYLYNTSARMVTASMVKIDILADLLHHNQAFHQAMSNEDNELATTMIEDSDNDSATDLWNQDGGVPAITEFNRLLGFSQTEVSVDWGEESTDPHDQLLLLKDIVLPNNVLDPASQSYEKTLMERVEPDEYFGIPSGVPKSAVVGVKNGWYPEPTTGWQVNTAGFVRLGKVYYLAVVMTGHNPSEDYGIGSVDGVSQLLWNIEHNLSRAHG